MTYNVPDDSARPEVLDLFGFKGTVANCGRPCQPTRERSQSLTVMSGLRKMTGHEPEWALDIGHFRVDTRLLVPLETESVSETGHYLNRTV